MRILPLHAMVFFTSSTNKRPAFYFVQYPGTISKGVPVPVVYPVSVFGYYSGYFSFPPPPIRIFIKCIFWLLFFTFTYPQFVTLLGRQDFFCNLMPGICPHQYLYLYKIVPVHKTVRVRGYV
uniref:Uncharacterized protein n=1 Tax=Cacopsylla melanoneura TaxID=428564 RepID=A0A8D8LSH0_9HEMI